MNPKTPFLLLLLVACGPTGLGDNPPYYDEDAVAPTLSGISPESETGNVGGQTLTLSGGHFGTDPEAIMAVFGGRNAEIVSVSDSELVVVAPHGPIEGGPVDVVVGTADGQATLAGGYTYTVDPVTDGQTAYVMVTEYSFGGDYSFDGLAELYEIAYPRVHAPLVGYWGAADTAGTWTVEIPDTALYTEWVDDLRTDIGDRFTLEIPALKELDDEDRELCYRPNYDFTYTGQVDGDTVLDPVTISAGLTDWDGCKGEGELQYDRSKVEFCKPPSPTIRENRYVADWPLVDGEGYSIDPIASLNDQGRVNEDGSTEVVLDLDPDDGEDGVTLVLPERFALRGTKGFVVSGDEADEPLWGGYGVNSCFDDDGDGNTSLDETALRWEWTPSELDAEALLAAAQEANGDGVVEDVRVYVNASVIYGAFSWLGLEGYASRATIEVDDSAGAIDMPAEILYQFPSINTSFGGTRLSSPETVNYAYLLLSVSRIVEYTVNTDDGKVVFAFVNAELGASGWSHPMDQGSCDDCLDNDGDGWTDDEDPDCARNGAGEEIGYGDSTCNDGIDNDEDGNIDGEDSVCEEATDGEDNCSDGRDNDRDGLTDEEDCECRAGLPENGTDAGGGCCNDVDDDGDGWTDAEDPDCEDGVEEIGYGEDACNNGLDDDGNGDIDTEDPFCLEAGADASAEVPTARSDCADGVDNDGDGYTDQNDPGCEFPYYSAEDTEPTKSADLVLSCYDGLDNDGDDLIDADDPDCALEGTPNGFQTEAE